MAACWNFTLPDLAVGLFPLYFLGFLISFACDDCAMISSGCRTNRSAITFDCRAVRDALFSGINTICSEGQAIRVSVPIRDGCPIGRLILDRPIDRVLRNTATIM